MGLPRVACASFSSWNHKVGANMISLGCISEYGVDISFTEPLTLEKMNTVVKYWKTFFINMGELNIYLQRFKKFSLTVCKKPCLHILKLIFHLCLYLWTTNLLCIS